MPRWALPIGPSRAHKSEIACQRVLASRQERERLRPVERRPQRRQPDPRSITVGEQPSHPAESRHQTVPLVELPGREHIAPPSVLPTNGPALPASVVNRLASPEPGPHREFLRGQRGLRRAAAHPRGQPSVRLVGFDRRQGRFRDHLDPGPPLASTASFGTGSRWRMTSSITAVFMPVTWG